MIKLGIRAAIAAGCVAACLGASPALAECKLGFVAEFHLDPKSKLPIADGEINGQPARVLIDTGSNITTVAADQAKRYGLGLRRSQTAVFAIGGEARSFEVDVKTLRIGKLEADNLHLIAVGDPKAESDEAVTLGEDILGEYDIEIDMADGYIRLLKPEGCSPDQLVYWNKPYSQVDLVAASRDSEMVMATALLNGRRQPVQIDSGSDTTVVDQHAASELGVNRGHTALDGSIGGSGPESRPSWTGQFASFALGDEQIAYPRLEVIKLTADMQDNGGASIVPTSIDGNTPPTMLIGADFLRAHHVLIARREHVMVFSYAGGPIFRTLSAPSTPATK